MVNLLQNTLNNTPYLTRQDNVCGIKWDSDQNSTFGIALMYVE